jgi:hypothetical protein
MWYTHHFDLRQPHTLLVNRAQPRQAYDRVVRKTISGRCGKRTESKADRVRPSLSKTASIVLGENDPNQDPDMTSIAKSIRFSMNFSAEICEFGCGRRNGCLRRSAGILTRRREGLKCAESGHPSDRDQIAEFDPLRSRKLIE